MSFEPKEPRTRASSTAVSSSSDFIDSSDLEKTKAGKVHVVEQVDWKETPEGEPHTSKPKPVSTAHEFVTEIITAEDDPTLNPWTARTWVLGIGLSLFGSATTAINTFKPQPVHIHLVFLVVLSFVLGTAWHKILPRKGWIGRFLNPHPFNSKEQTAIVIMAASASSTPEAMTVLAVQKLWYDMNPNAFIGLSLIFSAQMLGYGVAGVLRKVLVFPTAMLYPAVLPVVTLLETLHKDKENSRARMKYFYISFAVLFCWQTIPSYMMPLLGGISLFCLTNRKSLFTTNLFGGSMANEGLGVLSLSLDWQLIGGGKNPLWVPLQTLSNEFVGYFISIFLYLAIYYSGAWEARRFPFLSTMLFDDKSTSAKYIPFDVKRILNAENTVDPALVKKVGIPWFAASHASALVTLNVAIAATIVHMLLWHYQELKGAWSFLTPTSIKNLGSPLKWNWKFWQGEAAQISREDAEKIDPHYALMQSYKDVPNWWFGCVWVVSVVLALVAINVGKTTLPWWGFFVAVALSHMSLTFFAALTAMFGYSLLVQPFIQMIGAYLIPGKPIANMYFATYGFNSLYMAKHMLRDLKLGQYAHLAPRCTFTMQLVGTVIGCTMSYIMMQKITTEKRDILTSIQGTNIWSGQLIQNQNAAAVSWGGLAKYMYSINSRYWQVPIGFLIGIAVPFPFWIAHKFFPRAHFDYINTAIICAALGILSHGTHSAYLMYYSIGFFAQYYLRNYKPEWFIKYNYILSAGMDGGVSVINFILTFTVFGAAGKTVDFPAYFGNNFNKGNFDYCMRDPAMHAKKPKLGHGGGGGGG